MMAARINVNGFPADPITFIKPALQARIVEALDAVEHFCPSLNLCEVILYRNRALVWRIGCNVAVSR